jgi:hypothetical protein
MTDRPQKITFGEIREMGVVCSGTESYRGGFSFSDHDEVLMRLYVLAAAAASALLSGFISPTSAQEYPWCLQGRDWGYPGSCQFSTRWQCEATAAGTFSYCGLNPRFAYARQYPGYRRGY